MSEILKKVLNKVESCTILAVIKCTIVFVMSFGLNFALANIVQSK